MRKVQVKKLAPVSNPEVPTPEWEEYTPGQDNGYVSLPVEYELEGNELEEPQLNQVYRVARTKRNDVETPGNFTTSVVKEKRTLASGTILIKTQNSMYKIEAL